MHLHEKIALIRTFKGPTQEEMAEKLHMSTTGYAKIERGETQLKIPRLEKIVAVLGIELKDFLSFDETMVLNASSHDKSCQNNYVNPAKEIMQELETSRLVIEQKERENGLLKEQVSQLHEQISQLKQIIELMRK